VVVKLKAERFLSDLTDSSIFVFSDAIVDLIFLFLFLGFYYSPVLTEEVELAARAERTHTPQSIIYMMVFINPAVASLPEHHHLIGGHGCYKDVIDNFDGGIPCKGGDALPKKYQSLLNCKKPPRKEGEKWKDVPWKCEKNPVFP
jgi:hypothetical protein